jgi:AraC family transcriptional regulator of adaptative response/methylated-DNA-[protein]-cysteine methyltransferase
VRKNRNAIVASHRDNGARIETQEGIPMSNLDGKGVQPDQTTSVGPTVRQIWYATGESALGLILVAKSQHGVCAILLGEDRESLERDLQQRFPKAELVAGDCELWPLVAKVVAFATDPRNELDLPLDIRGTEFQRQVWAALRRVPAGSTVSYMDVARRIGAPAAVRAVAQACGANHLALAIPCHRVIRSDGELSGYRWGVERKRALLERESRALT